MSNENLNIEFLLWWTWFITFKKLWHKTSCGFSTLLFVHRANRKLNVKLALKYVISYTDWGSKESCLPNVCQFTWIITQIKKKNIRYLYIMLAVEGWQWICMSIFKPQIILFGSANARKRSNSSKNLYTREEALIYVPSDYGLHSSMQILLWFQSNICWMRSHLPTHC